MKMYCKLLTLLLLLFFPHCTAFAADSTSYAPPNVTQNRDMDRHGTAITNASTVRANVDMRAPIYYDSNNTSYYMNPSSSSYTNRVYAASDMRAPRYYDRDNTGYYMDPASDSHTNRMYSHIVYDKGNSSYYSNPASTSMFNAVRANIYYDRQIRGITFIRRALQS
jgi:hypothetical protein